MAACLSQSACSSLRHWLSPHPGVCPKDAPSAAWQTGCLRWGPPSEATTLTLMGLGWGGQSYC